MRCRRPTPTLFLALLVFSVPAFGAIGDLEGTYALEIANGYPWGLAFDSFSTPRRVFVSDYVSSRIFVYRVDGSALTRTQVIQTDALDSRFVQPRDLAIALNDGVLYLFALTAGPSISRAPRLWRVELGRSTAPVSIDLGVPAFGVGGNPVYGLSVSDGIAYISYDRSAFPTDRSSIAADDDEDHERGVLRLRIAGRDGSVGFWDEAAAGSRRAVVGHIPDSGDLLAFGLGFFSVNDSSSLWLTRGQSDAYAADAATGRGIFPIPIEDDAYGIDYGSGSLWVVHHSPSGPVVRTYRVSPDDTEARKGTFHVRRLELALKSTKQSDSGRTIDVTHHLMVPQTGAQRESQSRVIDSLSVTTNRPSQSEVSEGHYDPAEDTTLRQELRQVTFSGGIASGGELTSQLAVNVRMRDFRSYVYPHLCSKSSPSSGSWSRNDALDTQFVYRDDDTSTYDAFLDRVEASMLSEYGTSDLSNPFWAARAVMEYVVENYEFPDTDGPDGVAGTTDDESNIMDAGRHGWTPANLKLALTEPDSSNRPLVSCSPSAFMTTGVLRYLGFAARWVGTVLQSESGWDADGDGLFTSGETTSPTGRPIHRWSEAYLGPVYGWQRVDSTPDEQAPRQRTQWDLMKHLAQGVDSGTLVTQVGSGYHERFFDRARGDQGYTVSAQYARTGEFGTTETYQLSNACFLSVSQPATGAIVRGPLLTAAWTASGAWNLDPQSKVTIYAQKMLFDPTSGAWERDGARIELGSGFAYDAGTVDIPDVDRQLGNGQYRLVIVKQGDEETGEEGGRFEYRQF